MEKCLIWHGLRKSSSHREKNKPLLETYPDKAIENETNDYIFENEGGGGLGC